jgi:hypothetical protein
MKFNRKSPSLKPDLEWYVMDTLPLNVLDLVVVDPYFGKIQIGDQASIIAKRYAKHCVEYIQSGGSAKDLEL